MKRITALSLIIFLIAALLLSSCGTGIKKGDTKTDPEETTEAAAMENDSDDPEAEPEKETETETAAAPDTPVVPNGAAHSADGKDADLNAIQAELFEYINNNGLGEEKYKDVVYNCNAPSESEKAEIKKEGISHLNFSFHIDGKQEAEYVTYKSDRKVKIDGVTFDMPISHEDLTAAGWYTKDHNGQTLKYGYTTTGAIYNDEKGYRVGCMICNDKPDTEITFDKASVNELMLYPRSDQYNEPEIVFCGSLTASSTMKDVIEAIGAPESFFFTIWYRDGKYDCTECEISFTEKGNAYNNVHFRFDVDTGAMVEAKYGVSLTE